MSGFSRTAGQFRSWSEQEKYLQRRSDRRAFQDWLVEFRAEDPDTVLRSFGDILGEVLSFLADGCRGGSQGCGQARANHSLEQRAWVLLYAVRPDLIDGESMVDAAKWMGVTDKALVQKLKMFRQAVPALRVETNSRRGRPGNIEARMKRDQRAAEHLNSVRHLSVA